MAELRTAPAATPPGSRAAGRIQRLPSDRVLAGLGVAAALGGLSLVLAIMIPGSGFATWSWIAVGLIWPAGALASLAALRFPQAGPLAMIALGLAASLVFAWEFGMLFGVPLQAAGIALAWRHG